VTIRAVIRGRRTALVLVVATALATAACSSASGPGSGSAAASESPEPTATPLAPTVLEAAVKPAGQVPTVLAGDPALAALKWSSDRWDVMRTTVPGADAERLWWRLRDLAGRTGRWPVVLGDPGQQIATDPPDPEADLAAADELEPDGWFATRAQELKLTSSPMDVAKVDAAPQVSGPHVFWSVRNPETRAFHPSVLLALVPTPRPWEAAAYLGYGSWNDCPEPAAHVALMHEWYTRWGAETFALAGDQAELYVHRPPATAEEALLLGQQHYLYAPDDVRSDKDPARRENDTGALIGYHSWEFWWE
jgi:Domain of unknown function (DUF4253)